MDFFHGKSHGKSHGNLETFSPGWLVVVTLVVVDWVQQLSTQDSRPPNIVVLISNMLSSKSDCLSQLVAKWLTTLDNHIWVLNHVSGFGLHKNQFDCFKCPRCRA
jgi:hypothetical protein